MADSGGTNLKTEAPYVYSNSIQFESINKKKNYKKKTTAERERAAATRAQPIYVVAPGS